MGLLIPIESKLRAEQIAQHELVLRGSPNSVEKLAEAVDRTRTRFSYKGRPLLAISAVATSETLTLDEALQTEYLVTRQRYVVVAATVLIEAGFEVLPTFAAPHVSIVLPDVATATGQALAKALGSEHPNRYYRARGGGRP